MPYIVTTKRPLSCTCWGRVEAKMCRACRKGGKDVSRRAVATLDDARLAARTVVVDSALAQGTTAGTTDAYDSAFALPESGGTVGPLPDGTVIEVEPIGWANLARAAGRTAAAADAGLIQPAAPGQGQRCILDAFNAREAAR